MDYTDLYRSVYRSLSRHTPLEYDCGRLCRARCCKGSDNDGMLLFPGEQSILGSAGFLRIDDVEFGRKGSKMPAQFAVCSGKCIRALRPLACRIFPLAPKIDGGKLSLRYDPRAFPVCPLVYDRKSFAIEKSFADKVSESLNILYSVDEIQPFINTLSGVLDEYERFF